MRIAVLAPVAPVAPPPWWCLWEGLGTLLADGLVARGIDARLFSAHDLPDSASRPWVSLHGETARSLLMAVVFAQAGSFDLIHSFCGCQPLVCGGLTGTPLVTTICGVPEREALAVYTECNPRNVYIATRDAERDPALDYTATVHPGIDLDRFVFTAAPDGYLLFIDVIEPGSGARDAIEIARACNCRLLMAGPVGDREFFDAVVAPQLDGRFITWAQAPPSSEALGQVLGNAAALLCPAGVGRSAGLTALAAMACGTPVIAPGSDGAAELLSDGSNGFLADSLEAAAGAVARLDTIDRRQCRQTVVRSFSAGRMVECCIEIYDRVLAHTRGEAFRPWGHYEVLALRDTFQCKRIVVHPGKRFSLQRHQHRAEHWYVLAGQATVTLGDITRDLQPGMCIDIPRDTAHRIENTAGSDLVFIEIQTGDYFGEDDIERLEDDFGRG